MTASKIACLGEGLVVLAPAESGPLEHARSFTPGAGGAELNVAMTLASLGVEAAWLSRVGHDGFGRMLCTVLSERGVDVSAVEVDPRRPTGIYVKEIGRRSGVPHDLGPGASRMHYYRGGSAASALSPAYLRRAEVREVLRESAILHLSGITPALSRSADDTLRRIGRAFEGLVSVDANWRSQLWAGRETTGRRRLGRLMRSADIVFIGTDEAETILGTTDPGRVRAALSRPRYLVIKDSGGVATGFDGLERVEVPATKIDVVEAIGAGDAFAGGVLAGLVRGHSLSESMTGGHAAARTALSSTSDHA